MLILIARNISILIEIGFDPEIIPLQVCHFGNIMVFSSLVFRSKIAISIAWSLNLFTAFSSLIIADALEGYQTILCVRAQAYIWGHLFIVIGALYAVLLKIVRIDFKSFMAGIGVLFILLIPSIILNHILMMSLVTLSITFIYIILMTYLSNSYTLEKEQSMVGLQSIGHILYLSY